MSAKAQQHEKFLSVRESDPLKMGWKQGFPPPEGKRVHVADGSFFTFPALRRSVVHMRQLLPTVILLPRTNICTSYPK